MLGTDPSPDRFFFGTPHVESDKKAGTWARKGDTATPKTAERYIDVYTNLTIST